MLQTDDLFLGAFGLVRGGELHGVEVRGTNGRRVAVFTIARPGARRSGDATTTAARPSWTCGF